MSTIYTELDPPSLAEIGEAQKALAGMFPFHGLKVEEWILKRCAFSIAPLSAHCILTLDEGMHSCGWFKNPDYDTCWHLSLSFLDLETGESAPHYHKAADRINRGLFGGNRRLVWTEPPYTKAGKERSTWHYRLFLDVATRLPIKPRGEVYSRELTEKGWKSFSELNG